MRSTPHCLRRSSMKSATVFAMWRSSRQLFLPLLRPPFRWPSLLPPPLPPVCFFPPFLEAPDVLAILAARSLLMPFLRRPSYCLSSLTLEPWSLAMGLLLLRFQDRFTRSTAAYTAVGKGRAEQGRQGAGKRRAQVGGRGLRACVG